MAGLLYRCCGVSCRPDGTRPPARREWRVKTRSGASGDLGGTLWGPWSARARSFDAPRRAGRVLDQDSTAARSTGGQAFVEMSVCWESGRVGVRDQGLGVREPATTMVIAGAWSGHTTSGRGGAEAFCQRAGFGRIRTMAGDEHRSRRRLPTRRLSSAVLASSAERVVAPLA